MINSKNFFTENSNKILSDIIVQNNFDNDISDDMLLLIAVIITKYLIESDPDNDVITIPVKAFKDVICYHAFDDREYTIDTLQCLEVDDRFIFESVTIDDCIISVDNVVQPVLHVIFTPEYNYYLSKLYTNYLKDMAV